jgi:hypothetical protein
MAFRPKDLLLVPVQPTILVTTDTIDQCKPIADMALNAKDPIKTKEANDLVLRMPKLFTSYALQEN